jgi:hypothetical protein
MAARTAARHLRAVVVADAFSAGLSVEVRDPHSARIARIEGTGRWLLLDEAGPFCVAETGDYRLLVETRDEPRPRPSARQEARDASGARAAERYAVELWRLRH